MEIITEVQFTVPELRTLVKSLSIGADQLAKKLERFPKDSKGGGHHYRELCDEYESLTSALAECQSVLSTVLRSASE